MPPTAIVLNMFYTGLGIARSLGERGVPVIGLSARRGVFGNFTRYAKILRCPDSRQEPEALAAFLIALGKKLGGRSVIFPTRDDDLVFLDRFRSDLAPYFSLVVAESDVLEASLNKWETYVWAQRANVASPKCWEIDERTDITRIAADCTYPCVLKPLSSHHWRLGKNWNLVGSRKAIGISSASELLAEYEVIGRADKRALLQEMVPGGATDLVILACFLNRKSQWVTGFNTRKLVQVPEKFGTGCIVEDAYRPELLERTARLLETMRFTGIAEVEYKWDAAADDYKLIEINPRPWDQHRLGNACGVDLMYIAYCEHAGLPIPQTGKPVTGHKWIAEDTFVTTVVRLFWRREPGIGHLFRMAKGKRIYAIWSARDPLPLLVYLTVSFLPDLAFTGVRSVWGMLKRLFSGCLHVQRKGPVL